MSEVLDDGLPESPPDTPSSRLPGFHRRGVDERWRELARRGHVSPEELRVLRGWEASSFDVVNQMIENAVGVFSLPLGLGLNLTVNGRDHLVPMAVEEPSVVAAVSFAAKVVRQAGGFTAEADDSTMIAQVQLTRYGSAEVARARVLAAREPLLALANSFHPSLQRRGGGARDVQVRILPAPEGPQGEPLFIVHLLVDTQEAMGANLINTMAEGVAPFIEQLTGGRVFVRILSNLADQRLARASCRIPLDALADFDLPGEAIAEGILQASRFAEADPYRAATHNKGVMNGIDAVAIATGQDWRAIEAGAHAYACRMGRYGPLSRWTLEQGHLVGRIELPLALGLVGGPIRIHPGAQLGLKLLRVSSVRELAMVFASVGLAQNFAAVRALGSVGIQKGHMALHARCVAVTAGARGQDVEKVARLLVERGSVKVDTAREILASFPELAAP
ncbi:hydroxymethylglutaryl-CoA reductase, degradative [Corallococcus sp. H22C18031201]|uniref:hydroxymethylglutaryl-CoA reductase, degradative n=1 Tax=Citreicoccus inhibens TaxID=2849499 RepID=UPI000E70D78C|nr:hydroxymethylglutaryl-CoA reductase, degradative [Citreicoccus inhibens]MBU8894153.1 hydroxymethylglutaryl-CoA reductase, degradative [Citreicoccus inhibens]RJS23143.1 hydroxymethylglutaryl-CoA reductase, degradative [Corallococcus sp. H22C18031201]